MASRKKSARSGEALRLGGGRELPPLAFVTQRQKLADKISRAEADEILRAVGAGHRLIELTAAEATSAARAADRVRSELQGQPPGGVVLLGGYDVVPAARVNCLPGRLNRSALRDQDEDEFIVWSDDIYGDREGDWLPELPVSRIPDGKSARLMRSAISAAPANVPGRPRGLRNFNRPFADEIFGAFPGAGELLRSQPVRHDQAPPYSLDGERVYVVLHGYDTDATHFDGEYEENHSVGENEDDYPVAMRIGNVPARKGIVVFTGVCWGALIVKSAAVDVEPTTRLVHRDPDSSIALRFLLEGALAFVGCTGLHYSPVDKPYQYWGGPLHQDFWLGYNAGTPPAKALFRAKLNYQLKLPHRGRTGSLDEAIEFKTLRQYTCLGLGW